MLELTDVPRNELLVHLASPKPLEYGLLMRICLIGMSNIGKSFLSKRLKLERGFEVIDCDHEIELLLPEELQKEGLSGIDGVAKWMGQPYSPQYPRTSQRFSELERDVMLRSFNYLKTENPQSIVIDTSGSVIYTGQDVLAEMKKLTRIVYLESSVQHEKFLFDRYIKEPKPVIWDNCFNKQTGESDFEALSRCYPNLLQSRAEKFAAIADVTISYEIHREGELDLNRLLEFDK
jgi:shikimate kinase